MQVRVVSVKDRLHSLPHMLYWVEVGALSRVVLNPDSMLLEHGGVHLTVAQ